MGIVHFLNVKNGNCSIIQHPSGRVTVIDVCNAYEQTPILAALDEAVAKAARVGGNFNQKDYPVNPIAYLQQHGIDDVFRFILTHPDMDHMDGLKAFCATFPPTNFWDTDNVKEITFREGSPYKEEDWRYYKSIRNSTLPNGPKRLVLYAGAHAQFYNQGESDGERGDGLHILAPTPWLTYNAKACDDYNDGSYVILYYSAGGRVLFAGDSHDATWEYILKNHADDVRDVELLIAPHHGRRSGRSFDFLDVVNPALTLFGNADSEHLAYGAWNSRGLDFMTNNQAGCVVVDADNAPMSIYTTSEAYARRRNPYTFYSQLRRAYFCGTIKPHSQRALERLLASAR